MELNEVFRRVETIELAPDVRQLHLARLHALQRSQRINGRTRVMSGDFAPTRTRAVVNFAASAAAVAVVATTSALLVTHGSNGQHAPASAISQQPAAGGTATRPSSSVAVVSKTAGRQAISDAEFSAELAKILHLTPERASEVTTRLSALPSGDGTNSTAFAEIAASAGVSVDQLRAAIEQIKSAHSDSAAAPETKSANGSAVKTATSGTNLLTTPQGIDALATTLHLTRAQATILAGKLAAADGGDGLDPRSAEFAAIAAGVGVSPDTLAGAVTHIKLADQK